MCIRVSLLPIVRTRRILCVTVTACAVVLVAVWPLRAQDRPTGLPQVGFHLTAWPWEPLEIGGAKYLDAVESLCRYLASLQDERGAIVDPYLGREHQYATPYFAYPVGVLLEAGRASDLRAAGVGAMEHATACLAGGSRAIPDRHGEFFVAPLAEALALYRDHVEPEVWQTWQQRLQTPLARIMENQQGRTNNWRTYAMKGEWLRARNGLVARDDATRFIADAWTKRTQRERIVADKWNLYQDWSSDPQSHAVEAVGRGNLLALVTAGYDGPHAEEIARAVRRGTAASLLWQAPDGQCPPNGRTDDHVFNDVVYQLAFEVMAEDARARGETELAGQFRRAALLGFRSIGRWRRGEKKYVGSYFVTKNHFDPGERVGYQPASQYTNYNGAIAYHLAEAYRSRRSPIAERPVPAEIGGYVVAADPRFASVVANAGGMQIVANLRGDTVAKYGKYWTPLGVVRFGRAGWDGRLGPSDGVHDAASRRSATFGPTWREAGRWVRLAERAEDYRGTLHTEFVHPLLVRFQILYHPVTGRGGPTFRHEFVVTPDGVLATLACSEKRSFGLTLPLVVDDGRPLAVDLAPPCLAVSYPRETDAAGDEQNFLLLDAGAKVEEDEPIRSAVGWLKPVRVTSSGETISVFAYPRSAGDPAAAEVQSSFRLLDDGFTSSLCSVRGKVYRGRTAAGGQAERLVLDDAAKLEFDEPCGFVLQLDAGGARALETDRPAQARFGGGTLRLEKFSPIELPRHGSPE